MTESAATTLVERFVRLHPGDAARTLEAARPTDIARVLSRHPERDVAELIRHLRADHAVATLIELDDAAARRLLETLDPARAARLVGRIEDPERSRFLALVTPGLARELSEILTYPSGTAGALMDARVATFRADNTVGESLERIRDLGDRRITDLVVTGPDERLEGLVRLQVVAGAPPDQTLSELLGAEAPAVHAMTPRDQVVELLNQHRLASLPVVDVEGRVVGIIRHGGLVDAAQQAATADLQQMVGGSAEERALSSVWVKVKSRLPWLNINLVTAFAASAVVGVFEDTIAQFTALAVLLPVVAGQSGNTGAQALAVTMRGLALREIRVSHAARVVSRELGVGFVNGVAIAAVTSVGVYLWSDSSGLAAVMFLAMLSSMMIASVAGALVPVVLVKLGRDPATASSIILTTVTDIAGFASFLGLATALSDILTP